jgi:glycosyltransferase involved in cell wall biosynthesis
MNGGRQPVTVAPKGRGGIRSVVEGYRSCGFFERHDARIIWSYEEGGVLHRQLVLARALLQFVAQLAGRRVALLHCHVAAHGSFFRKGLFAELARLFGRPVLWHLHASKMQVFHEAQPAPGRWFIRRQFERATRVIVLSPQWRDYVASIAPGSRIEVLANAVPLRPAGDATGAQDGAVRILSLGLVGQRKGSYDLIEAFARLAPHVPQASLTIAGNGEVERARTEVSRLGLDGRVHLPGWIEAAQKDQLLASAQIYVLPSYNEGLPVSVLEAMAAAVPVVTTPVGGLPDLIANGGNGILTPAGDREALAAVLVELCRDVQMRRRIGAAGRETIANTYAQDVVMPKLDAIYRDVLRDEGQLR